ncbi:MAG: hypothetical protein M3Y64_00110, partial [Gemmatimonadota bacterium]|nr:hypothetical protein [Gemmatimonadota bacterium]
MRNIHINPHPMPTPVARKKAAVVALMSVAIFAAACSGDQVADGPYKDVAKPHITLAKGNTTADSLLPVNFSARDDIGIKSVHVTLSGGMVATYDTTLTSAATALDVG